MMALEIEVLSVFLILLSATITTHLALWEDTSILIYSFVRQNYAHRPSVRQNLHHAFDLPYVIA